MGGGKLYIIFLFFWQFYLYLLHFIKAYIFSNEPKILNNKLKLDRSLVVYGQSGAVYFIYEQLQYLEQFSVRYVFNFKPLKILDGLNILSSQDNQNIGNEYILQYIDRDAAETEH
ncbi:Hypothetical_protein [Hexamita inflata]|uniref:Hypothetical_protein n=1 Tax=Hexamita inflata TaxID=28002 RepID=A0AA86TJE6_9EUKA|nr:Hypothetical protein HINF_LOCUS5222 [Hexamita inflata]